MKWLTILLLASCYSVASCSSSSSVVLLVYVEWHLPKRTLYEIFPRAFYLPTFTLIRLLGSSSSSSSWPAKSRWLGSAIVISLLYNVEPQKGKSKTRLCVSSVVYEKKKNNSLMEDTQDIHHHPLILNNNLPILQFIQCSASCSYSSSHWSLLCKQWRTTIKNWEEPPHSLYKIKAWDCLNVLPPPLHSLKDKSHLRGQPAKALRQERITRKQKRTRADKKSASGNWIKMILFGIKSCKRKS